jgi:2-amino-4-hydroxy-6-hydroxymethyldihydropteridine diphosphokinase
MRAGIALGSNLGDRLANLQEARIRSRNIGGVSGPFLQSAIYETAPIGCEAGAANFYNAVIELEFVGSPSILLTALGEIERALGRPRDHTRNVSRRIDLDLLYLGELERDEPELQLPHPRIAEREFVLRPLADIAPDLRLPGQTATVRELLAQLKPSDEVKRVAAQW